MSLKLNNPLVLILLTAALLITACSSKTLPAGIEIDGKVLRISLEENPTTGYSWDYETSDESVLEETGDEYITSATESGIVGSGGIRNFTFQGLKAGETTLTFNYFRSWEGAEKRTETKVYKVTVDAYGTIKSVE